MTQQEFIKKFKIVCKQYGLIGVYTEVWDIAIQMRYNNYQDNKIVDDFVSEVGFFNDDFYMSFSDNQWTAYENELKCNSEDDWDLLWQMMIEHFGVEDFELHNFKPGDVVYWNDPAINDYPEEERVGILKRRFVVFDVNGEIISISDTYSEAEVCASELIHIS